MTRPLCLILSLCLAACVAQSGDQASCDKASDGSCLQEHALSEQQALLQTKGARLSKVEKHARQEPDDNVSIGEPVSPDMDAALLAEEEYFVGSDDGAYEDWEEDEEGARQEPDDNVSIGEPVSPDMDAALLAEEEYFVGSDDGAYEDYEEDEEGGEPVLAEDSAWDESWDDDEVAEDWKDEDEVAEDTTGEALIQEEEDEAWKVAEATSDEDAEAGNSQSLAETPRGGSGGKGKGKGKG